MVQKKLVIVLLLTIFSLCDSKPLDTCGENKDCLNYNKYMNNKEKNKDNNLYCGVCEIFLPIFRSYVNENNTERISELIIYGCDLLKIENPTICYQVINLFKYPFFSILRDSPLTSIELCSVEFGCSEVDNPILDWNITLPSVPKPPVKPLVPPNVNLIIFLFLHKYY